MTKVSHEVPLDLLEQSRWFNDYDYALVHLFVEYPEYYNFYKHSLQMGREVLLDNSLYELGEAFDMSKYAEWIEKLHPTYYIIPDKFWDSDGTIELANEWMKKYGNKLPKDIKRIGVAQGSSYQDIVYTYNYMDAICDKIAFTFKFHPDMIKIFRDNLTFDKLKMNHCYVRNKNVIKFNEDINDTDLQALLRYVILKELDLSGVINKEKEHHLLGLQSTAFLKESCKFSWVTSIDTSNPIIYGYEGKKYEESETDYEDIRTLHNGNCCIEKSKTTLKDLFEEKFEDRGKLYKNFQIIKYNVNEFKKILDMKS